MPVSFENLKILRKNHQMSQEELAEKLGVSRQAVAKWENGTSYPNIECCVKLSELYGVSIDMLIKSHDLKADDDKGKHIFGICKVDESGKIKLPPECLKTFNIEIDDNILILGDESKGIALVNLKKGGF